MIVKLVLVFLFGAFALWMCSAGLRRTRTPQGMVLGGVPQAPTCPNCGGPTTAPATPCASCASNAR